mmetsp:Transcript_37691/g.97239  ORF Transcript_37691/g.97239 Transcript_37691/m.97239 type:complete len:330 (-) Transcript_37691:139-1128(-)
MPVGESVDEKPFHLRVGPTLCFQPVYFLFSLLLHQYHPVHPSVEEVCNNTVDAILFERSRSFLDENGLIRFEFERNNKGIRTPLLSKSAQHFGCLLEGERERAGTRLNFVIGHVRVGQKEVSNGSCEVYHAPLSHPSHSRAEVFEVEQVVLNGGEVDSEQHVVGHRRLVPPHYLHQVTRRLLSHLLAVEHQAPATLSSFSSLLHAQVSHKVAERTLKAPRVREEGGLSVQKHHRVPLLYERLHAVRPSRARAEVVHEPHRVLLQGHGGAAGGDQHDAPLLGYILFDEVLCCLQYLFVTARGALVAIGRNVGDLQLASSLLFAHPCLLPA